MKADQDWLPALRRRAGAYQQVRAFFEQRGVLEVETPVLSHGGTTDPQIESLSCLVGAGGSAERRYLRTSPEFFHKRLLAAGVTDLFELAKVFRDGEFGARHNPEFTLLEWYRSGWDHYRLMDEVSELVQRLLDWAGQGHWPVRTLSFAELFVEYAGVDPLHDTRAALDARLAAAGVMGMDSWSRDEALDYLRGAVIEPALPTRQLTFVVDFPASQAALARILPGDPPLAARFELYLGQVELANGYHELTDAAEQRRRFEADLAVRGQRSQPLPRLDEALLTAMEQGLPDCAGVALGMDRLLLALGGATDLRQLLPFPHDQA